MLTNERVKFTSAEIFRMRLGVYPEWEKSSRVNLAQNFLEKRRLRLAQMTSSEVQEAEVLFEQFKLNIDRDRSVENKLYL